jgi:hypothetical protein
METAVLDNGAAIADTPQSGIDHLPSDGERTDTGTASPSLRILIVALNYGTV